MFYAILAVFSALIVVADQLTKHFIVATIPLGGVKEAIPWLFQLTYIQNTGMAFPCFGAAAGFFWS